MASMISFGIGWIGSVGSSEIQVLFEVVHGDELAFDAIILADLKFALVSGAHGER